MFLSKYIGNFGCKRAVTFCGSRLRSNTALDIEKLEKDSVDLDVIDEEAKQREEQIELKRNKSRLYQQHRNMVHDTPPYKEAKLWTHGTVKYQRKLYGRYGEASGVDPSICWPTKLEMADRKEYERVAFPKTIPEMVTEEREKKLKQEERAALRQEEVVKKIQKLDMWTKDLQNRLLKKEAEVRAVKERKEKLIEEVRRHFGYKVDPKDDKFKEMLEKKEKEQKKVMKEARKKAKEARLLDRLQQTNPQESKPAETTDK